MYKILILICVLGLEYLISFGQKQSDVWCFGYNAMVDFSSGSPIDISPSAIHTDEGCTSIADNNGNLLFYTDGTWVWDKNHLQMPNGFGLRGHSSSTQSAIITPVIDKLNQYYIFTADGNSSGLPPPYELNYSIVDMELPGNGTINNPSGDINSTKNTFLTSGTIEKITAIMHTDMVSYWIVVPVAKADTFYSYHVDCNGVNPTPFISTLSNFTVSPTLGYMKSSSDGKMLAAAFSGPRTVVVFDFDNGTGEVSNPQTIATDFWSAYGVEFSPNDSLIYACNLSGEINQYQRFAPNIGATEIEVYNGTVGGALQLANNGKIYFSKIGQNSLGCIQNPNQVNSPTVIPTAISFAGTGIVARFGLPNFFSIYVNGKFDSKIDTFNICLGDSVEIGPTSLPGYQYLWSPATFLSNTNISKPYAKPTTTTKYQLLTITQCNDTIIDSVTVYLNDPDPVFTANFLSGCKPLTVVFNDTTSPSPVSCKWQFGDGGTSDICDPTYVYTTSGSYSVQLLVRDAYGCRDSITQSNFITVYTDPVAAFVSDPQSASIVNPVIGFIDFSSSEYGPIASWDWIFGDDKGSSTLQNPSYSYQDVGNFRVQLIATDANGCKDTAYQSVYIYSNFVFYSPNSFTPNGDGINDLFEVQSSVISNFRMSIFDRWGSTVFNTNNINEGWNGNINGGTRLAMEDIYVYVVDITDYNGVEHHYKGRVTLIR